MKKKDYVINGHRVTVHGHDADHVIGEIISTGKDIVKGAKDILGIKLSKRKFYAYRDDLYSKAKKIYGIKALELPGNPFGAFSHKTIKDSPLKDYTKEKNALDETFMKYLPKVFGSVVPVQSTKDLSEQIADENISETARTHGTMGPRVLESQSAKVLKPFKPIMRVGVSNAGFVPPENIDALALIFYDKVVKPGTQSTYDHCDHLDEVVVDSILHFIATLQAKREAGEPMNKTYEKIADTATKLQEKAGDAGKEIAGQKVGNFIVDNAAAIGLGLGALVLVVMLAKK